MSLFDAWRTGDDPSVSPGDHPGTRSPHEPRDNWRRRFFLRALGLGLAGVPVAACAKPGPEHRAQSAARTPPPAPAAPAAAPPGPVDQRHAAIPCGSAGAEADATTKEIAQRLVSSAENSSLDWRAQYGYIEDIGDGRGYTAGLIGFTTGTGDLLEVVTRYSQLAPGNALEPFVPALQRVRGSASLAGLHDLPAAWRGAAADPRFQRAQDEERDRVYFTPAVTQARTDGLRALGQYCYYDAIVMHGPGDDSDSFGGIRAAATRRARPPALGGDETTYLNAFLDVRRQVMRHEAAHDDTSRVDTAQRRFLQAGNLDLRPPLRWTMYGDAYELRCQ